MDNITVSSTNTSTTRVVNPHETDPERLRIQRQKLKTLYHAANCCQDHGRESVCNVRHCLASKALYKHVTKCTQACPIPGCRKGRHIWKHYRDCKVSNCRICSAVPTTFKETGIHTKYEIKAKSSSASTRHSIATRSSDTSSNIATPLASQDIIKSVPSSGVNRQSRSTTMPVLMDKYVKRQSRPTSYGPTMPALMNEYENEDKYIRTSRSSATRSSDTPTTTTSATTLASQDIIKPVTTSVVKIKSRSTYGPPILCLVDDKYEQEEEDEYTTIMPGSPSSVQDKALFLKPRLEKALLQVQQQQQPGSAKSPQQLKDLFTQRSHMRRVFQERLTMSTAATNTTTTKDVSALAKQQKQQQQGGRRYMTPPLTGYMIPRHKQPQPQKNTILSPPRRLDARYDRPPMSPTRTTIPQITRSSKPMWALV